MTRLALLAAVLAGAIANQAAAECEKPTAATVPDGSTATLEEMLEAQTAVRTYLAEMEQFLACLNEEIDTQPEDTPQATAAAMIERYNASVTEMETVAAEFNAQRIAYQQANPAE